MTLKANIKGKHSELSGKGTCYYGKCLKDCIKKTDVFKQECCKLVFFTTIYKMKSKANVLTFKTHWRVCPFNLLPTLTQFNFSLFTDFASNMHALLKLH